MPIPPLSAWNEARRLIGLADAKQPPPREDQPVVRRAALEAAGLDEVVERFVKVEATNQEFLKDDLLGTERWKIQVTYPDERTLVVRFVKKG